MSESQQTEQQNSSYRYWAFISYSHQDKQWGDWLHKALETYRVPGRLADRPSRDGRVPKRLYPVFRDREELPSSSDLGAQLKDAMRQSRYLIVICSPRSAKSRWVNEEVLVFKSLGRENRILCLIVDGEPHASSPAQECFGEALRYRWGADGQLSRELAEPIAADARADKDGKANAKLKLLAGILGVNFDELKQREKRRRRWQRVQIALGIVCFVGAMLGIWRWQEHRKAEQARLAQIERWTEQGRRELIGGSPLRALPYLSEAYREGGTATVLRLLLAQAANALESQVSSFGGPSDPVGYAAFSPDGTRLVTESANHNAKVWNTANGEMVLILEGSCDRMIRPSFSPDGSRIATARGKSAKLWSANDGGLLASLDGHKFDVKSVAFSPDGSRVVTASVDDTAKVWNAADGKLLVSLTGHLATVRSAVFSPDGKLILTVSADESAKVWDATTGTLAASIPLHAEGVELDFDPSASFSPDGSRIVTLSGHQVANVWNASGKLLSTLRVDKPRLISVSFSPNGSRAMAFSTTSTTDDNTIEVWDVDSNKILMTLEGHKGWVAAIESDFSGSHFVTTSFDTTARIWDAASGAALNTLEGHKGFVVSSATYSPDGTRLVTVDGDGWARVWDMTGGKLFSSFQAHSNQVNTVAFSPDGTRLITSSVDRTAKIWDAMSGKQLGALTDFIYPVNSAVLSRDGTRIITASGFGAAPSLHDSNARVWDVVSGQLLLSLSGHSNALSSVLFNPDSTRVITTSQDNTAKLWDVTNGSLLATFAPPHTRLILSTVFSSDGRRAFVATHGDENTGTVKIWDWDFASEAVVSSFAAPNSFFYSVAFSFDGSRILTASGDQTVMVWDRATGKVLTTLEGRIPFGAITGWNPDGSLIVTGSESAVKIWDAASGRLLTDLEGHPSAVTGAGFSPDGSRLATGSTDGTVKVWDLHLETRSPEKITSLVKARAPWQLVDDSLVPAVTPQP